VLAGVFLLLAALDAVQLVEVARGNHPDPPALVLTHALTGVLAAGAAVAIWRLERWSPWVVLAWGLVTATMLAALGPAIGEPREAWAALRLAAVVTAAATALAAAYLRWRLAGRRRR
jgi:peptidoglycan/LPS O-acetylase OafA/YrhL